MVKRCKQPSIQIPLHHKTIQNGGNFMYCETISKTAGAIIQNVGKAIYGKDEAITLVVTALLCRGHVLPDDIPGTGKMVLNWFEWERDGKDIPKIHPAQKPVKVLKKLIETFTDPVDVVIDPCFGSGSTARACLESGRNFYGLEINKKFYERAVAEMVKLPEDPQMDMETYLKEIG
jgi:hypothetical protein